MPTGQLYYSNDSTIKTNYLLPNRNVILKAITMPNDTCKHIFFVKLFFAD